MAASLAARTLEKLFIHLNRLEVGGSPLSFMSFIHPFQGPRGPLPGAPFLNVLTLPEAGVGGLPAQ